MAAGTHREQSHFDRAGWRKRILLPCWIIQIPIALAQIGIFAYRLSNTITDFKDEEERGNVPMVEFVWECVNIAFSGVSFVISTYQIAKFIAEALTPFSVLFGNTVSLTLSLAVLALDIVVYHQHSEKEYSIVALSLDCALVLFTIIPIIYAIIIFRRLSEFDQYAHPQNVKHYGFLEKEMKQQDTSYEPYRMSMNIDPEAAYDPAPQPSRRSSWRLSAQGASSSQSSPKLESRPDAERRPSYDHKRDTQFDEYVARRSRSNSLQEGAEKAMKQEFGFTPDPRDSLNIGMVPAALTPARAEPSARAASWDINLGETPGSPGSSIQRGHSLNSVPEAHEPQDAAHTTRDGRHSDDSRESLLSGGGSPDTNASDMGLHQLGPVQVQDVGPLRLSQNK